MIHEIRSAETEISVLNIEDVEKHPAKATETNNVTLVSQWSENESSPEDRVALLEPLFPAESGNNISETVFFDNYGKEGNEVQGLAVKESDDIQMQDLSKNKFGPVSGSEEPHSGKHACPLSPFSGSLFNRCFPIRDFSVL